MNPTDFYLLVPSIAFAALCLAVHGPTLNGIGPAGLALAGCLWQLWMQSLRHRSWLRHRDSGFAPGTQPLALAAALGWFLAIASSVTWALITLPRR
jgi:hypothetical protein